MRVFRVKTGRHSLGGVLALTVLLASLLMPLAPVRAQDSTSSAAVQISLRPTDGKDGDRFEVEITPGQSTTLSATLQNFGSDAIELRTYTADVLPVANGGLGLAKQGSEQHAPTTWMTYPDETLTLQAGESVERPITIAVPADTPPGQYVNALALETVNPVKTQGAFEQYFQKVVSVYITVPGPIEPGFTLGKAEIVVQGTSGAIQIPLENTGNIRLDLTGTITVKDATGTAVLTMPLTLGPIYAKQRTYVQVPLPVLPPAGSYTVSAEFTDEAQKVSQSAGDMAIEVPQTAAEQAPIAFQNVKIEPNASPITFANVSLDVVVKDTPLKATRLTLSVSRDGKPVEDFVLADNLALPQGSTTVTQRYLPAAGWTPGTYTFSLKLESIDPATKASSVVLTQDDVASFKVP